ncbi:uncharacterized protein LOC129599124 [Paramacrobiotus metropolitanus]|uniref:uncharacterized protein LOC129599124 n=1 Tax=Paramacrobiotus metropolitanus TaxID=2943436 RepID=UPI0024458F53|nr:uncharacterized protein LOC129599124 [Paramacrobiotus metropolitanus]
MDAIRPFLILAILICQYWSAECSPLSTTTADRNHRTTNRSLPHLYSNPNMRSDVDVCIAEMQDEWTCSCSSSESNCCCCWAMVIDEYDLHSEDGMTSQQFLNAALDFHNRQNCRPLQAGLSDNEIQFYQEHIQAFFTVPSASAQVAIDSNPLLPNQFWSGVMETMVRSRSRWSESRISDLTVKQTTMFVHQVVEKQRCDILAADGIASFPVYKAINNLPNNISVIANDCGLLSKEDSVCVRVDETALEEMCRQDTTLSSWYWIQILSPKYLDHTSFAANIQIDAVDIESIIRIVRVFGWVVGLLSPFANFTGISNEYFLTAEFSPFAPVKDKSDASHFMCIMLPRGESHWSDRHCQQPADIDAQNRVTCRCRNFGMLTFIEARISTTTTLSSTTGSFSTLLEDATTTVITEASSSPNWEGATNATTTTTEAQSIASDFSTTVLSLETDMDTTSSNTTAALSLTPYTSGPSSTNLPANVTGLSLDNATEADLTALTATDIATTDFSTGIDDDTTISDTTATVVSTTDTTIPSDTNFAVTETEPPLGNITEPESTTLTTTDFGTTDLSPNIDTAATVPNTTVTFSSTLSTNDDLSTDSAATVTGTPDFFDFGTNSTDTFYQTDSLTETTVSIIHLNLTSEFTAVHLTESVNTTVSVFNSPPSTTPLPDNPSDILDYYANTTNIQNPEDWSRALNATLDAVNTLSQGSQMRFHDVERSIEIVNTYVQRRRSSNSNSSENCQRPSIAPEIHFNATSETLTCSLIEDDFRIDAAHAVVKICDRLLHSKNSPPDSVQSGNDAAVLLLDTLENLYLTMPPSEHPLEINFGKISLCLNIFKVNSTSNFQSISEKLKTVATVHPVGSNQIKSADFSRRTTNSTFTSLLQLNDAVLQKEFETLVAPIPPSENRIFAFQLLALPNPSFARFKHPSEMPVRNGRRSGLVLVSASMRNVSGPYKDMVTITHKADSLFQVALLFETL